MDHLDIVSYPLVALCDAVGLLCFFFSFLLMGYLCLFLPRGLFNDIFSVASIFASQLITK